MALSIRANQTKLKPVNFYLECYTHGLHGVWRLVSVWGLETKYRPRAGLLLYTWVCGPAGQQGSDPPTTRLQHRPRGRGDIYRFRSQL